MRVLLKQEGAKDILDIRNMQGRAAIHLAEAKPDIVAMLVEAGADPDLEKSPPPEGG